MPSNPLDVVRAGIKAVPAVKYALGVAGVAAALALATAFFSSTQAAVIGILAMLALMVLLVVFASLTSQDINKPNPLRYQALVMTWVVLVVFCGIAILVFTSVFFERPKPFPQIVATLTSVEVPDSTGDDEVQLATWYQDNDEDGFGNREQSTESEAQPSGYVDNSEDCYDLNPEAKPGQERWFIADRGDGSFDYDCNDRGDRQFTIIGQCSGGQANPKGWGGSTIPSCGMVGPWVVDCDRHMFEVEREYDSNPHTQACR